MKTPITFLEYMDIKSWTTMAIAYHAWYAKIENSGIFQVVSTFLKKPVDGQKDRQNRK